jgi:nitroimidazol reductase NimA-like FMN-containing flavoprotein (pyridoxamine 5'-phosphate oxidase superfamily)
VDVCITVTLTDGIVVARTAFHHSLNYRSVVALGKARALTDPEEKNAALDKITNHLLPGRVSEVSAVFNTP